LVLIDGSGFIFRAFHALPPMTRPDGTPVNAVFGFTNMLVRLLKDHAGNHFAVIFDAGRLTFRNRLYDGYKAQRPEPPEELRPQFAVVRDATAAFGVPTIELADWEADDLIASYALAAEAVGWRTTIVSSDKDLMQLIRPGVSMLEPMKQKPIGPAEVMEKWGVPPGKLVELQALMGDAVDNVPGVPGIGPKTAAQLIGEFGDLEAVLAAAPAMKPSKKRDMLIAHAEAARLSRRLVELRDDAPLPLPLAELVVREPDRAQLATWLHLQGFRSTLLRLGLEEPGAAPVPPPAATGPQGALDFAEPAARQPPRPAPRSDQGYGPYATVTTLAALEGWLAEATAAGVVAVDTETDALVAIKIPSIDLRDDPAYLKRFMMEEWVARRVDSPHVLKPCLHARKRNFLYVVTEYIDGQTLTQWMIDNPKPDLETVRGIVEQIARGLRAFHRKEMLHQDVRPDNIMIDRTGTAKIIDFGSTKITGLAETAPSAGPDEILGTVQYTAPEYFLRENGSPRSDMFSLGVITYQMLTGKLPYGAQIAKARTRSQFKKLKYRSALDDNNEIPAWIDGTLRRAVHPDPYKRYESLSEYTFDLRHPNAKYLNPSNTPLVERNPPLFWKTATVILAIFVLALLASQHGFRH